ncbi:MAG: flagellar basal body-associated FliL family protein [Rhodobacteraceae bacterium]|jgi:flagellar FliL protein|nr:flagellar basal body-associated FliL family protein [Paracoccaceae bacterium]
MRKLLPVILALLGLVAGGGAGFLLRPAATAGEEHAAAGGEHAEESSATTQPEYVKLNNQFIVPVLEGGRIVSMVILTLSLEVATGTSEAVYAKEPKLRDAFLQVLFDHANTGGFRGSFTDASNLVFLRKALTEKAAGVLGSSVTDVLITDIARQDG